MMPLKCRKRASKSYTFILGLAMFLSGSILAYGQDDPKTAEKDMVDEVIRI